MLLSFTLVLCRCEVSFLGKRLTVRIYFKMLMQRTAALQFHCIFAIWFAMGPFLATLVFSTFFFFFQPFTTTPKLHTDRNNKLCSMCVCVFDPLSRPGM